MRASFLSPDVSNPDESYIVYQLRFLHSGRKLQTDLGGVPASDVAHDLPRTHPGITAQIKAASISEAKALRKGIITIDQHARHRDIYQYTFGASSVVLQDACVSTLQTPTLPLTFKLRSHTGPLSP